MLSNKVDFIFTIRVDGANPNGDPLAGNMPRVDGQGFGQISDVCIKRKIRNRMQDMGHEIFVQSQDRIEDGYQSLEERFGSIFSEKDTNQEITKECCEKWLDIRSFGQVITYFKKSIGIRGPVSISVGKSIDPVDITSMQITKSVNSMKPKNNDLRSSDTMGMKHYVDFGVYVVTGSVNCYFAEKTGFSEEDLQVLKEAIQTLFVNDISTARPDGSMEVMDMYWITHSSKIGDVSSSRIRELLLHDKPSEEKIKPKYEDYKFRLDEKKVEEYKKLGLQIEHFRGW